MSCPVYPTSSITDAQWAVLEPLLPAPGNAGGRGGRPESHPRRLVLDAIFYLVRGGIAWAALPHDFPPHQTVYGIFGRWARSGAWQAIHDGLRDLVRVHEGRDPLPTAAIIDSQSVRAADTVPGPFPRLRRQESCRATGCAGFGASDGCRSRSAGVRQVRGSA